MSYIPDPNPGSHADIHRRHPLSAPGKFFVDDCCLDCDLCRETAVGLFVRDDSSGTSYLVRQPVTAEELALVKECVEGCCVSCIGDTGDQHDWEKSPPTAWGEPTERSPEPTKDCPNCPPKKP
jgi:ferredoxin